MRRRPCPEHAGVIESIRPWHTWLMSLPINWGVLWVAGPLVLVAGACSPEPEPAPEPLAVSASIPVEGGSIELADGARVEFPAGALTEEAEVTLRRLDCGGIYQSASFGSCRYAVEGPEELLVQPYQLRLPTRAPARASQQTVDGLVSVIGSEDQAEASHRTLTLLHGELLFADCIS